MFPRLARICKGRRHKCQLDLKRLLDGRSFVQTTVFGDVHPKSKGFANGVVHRTDEDGVQPMAKCLKRVRTNLTLLFNKSINLINQIFTLLHQIMKFLYHQCV